MKKPVFHASLNPHPDDKLTQEELIAIIFSIALDDAARPDYDPDEWDAMLQPKKKRKPKRKL